MNDVSHDATDDEVTLDPDLLDDSLADHDVTSVADASWLAELRATAKSTDRTMSDVLDDEATIAPDADTMDAVRSAVAAARAEQAQPQQPEVPPTPPAPSVEPTSPLAPVPAETPATARVPDAPTASAPTDARPAPPTRPTPSQAPTSGPRWEPPQRLAPVVEVAGPTLRATAAGDPILRRLLVGILLVGVAVLALVAFIVLRGSNDPPPEVPDDTVVEGEFPVEDAEL